MSSLLTSDVAAQASVVNGETTTGAVSRSQFDQQNTLSQSELNAVASGTTFSGGKKSKSKRKGKKTARRSKRRVRIFTRKGKSYLRRPAR